MKKGIIIINAFAQNTGQDYQLDRYKEEFAKLGVEIEIVRNNRTIYIDHSGNVVPMIPQADFVLYLDKDKHVASMLEKAGNRLFNSSRSIELTDDKMNTYIALANSGIAMPKTIASPLCYNLVVDDKLFIQRLTESLQFPIVIKECYGSFGKQVYLVNKMEELTAIRHELIGKKHLYQELIKSSYGFDTRVIVIGGEVFAWFRRNNTTGDFRSNIEIGGNGEMCELPNSFKQCAEKAARIIGLDYCGVDLLTGNDGEPILCEVNSNAFFRGIESVTGANVAEAYCKHIYNEIYGKNKVKNTNCCVKDFQRLPSNIAELTRGKSCTLDSIGMSGSTIAIYDKMVLKIERNNAETVASVQMMNWLQGKLPIPKIICYEIVDGTSYLLMSRIKGKMACDDYYLSRPQLLVKLLSQALKMLWSVDLTGCPCIDPLEQKLAVVKQEIDKGLVKFDPNGNQFGRDDFTPSQLWDWLVANKPTNNIKVLSHGDFCLPNIFLDGDKVSGFIDVGSSGLDEKWNDIALCYRSLNSNLNGGYGGKVYDNVNPNMLFDELGIEPDWDKIKYYTLLDELF